MYETGTAVEVRAFHVMPGLPPPEGERHFHDYRIDVVARREELDDRGMVVDLDLLNQALQDTAARLDGADLDRLIPDEPAVTVEVFARWMHQQVTAALGRLTGTTLAVRVWENPIAFGGYSAAP
jgi:6-pyruvoyltetrahydropterin/6-carboxytetrahydropterin synthase